MDERALAQKLHDLEFRLKTITALISSYRHESNPKSQELLIALKKEQQLLEQQLKKAKEEYAMMPRK
jgi:DNA-binding transcriptional MerR regulator